MRVLSPGGQDRGGPVRLQRKQQQDGIFENAAVNPLLLWPGGVLRYQIDPQFKQEDIWLIRGTLDILSERLESCIKFEEVEINDRVFVTNGRVCSSFIGYMQQETQEISLNSEGCLRKPGTIMHEFIHFAELSLPILHSYLSAFSHAYTVKKMKMFIKNV